MDAEWKTFFNSMLNSGEWCIRSVFLYVTKFTYMYVKLMYVIFMYVKHLLDKLIQIEGQTVEYLPSSPM